MYKPEYYTNGTRVDVRNPYPPNYTVREAIHWCIMMWEYIVEHIGDFGIASVSTRIDPICCKFMTAPSECHDCPVSQHTSEVSCLGTPFGAFNMDIDGRDYAQAEKAANGMIDLLKGLLRTRVGDVFMVWKG